jgi:hypothetical protein
MKAEKSLPYSKVYSKDKSLPQNLKCCSLTERDGCTIIYEVKSKPYLNEGFVPITMFQCQIAIDVTNSANMVGKEGSSELVSNNQTSKEECDVQ